MSDADTKQKAFLDSLSEQQRAAYEAATRAQSNVITSSGRPVLDGRYDPVKGAEAKKLEDQFKASLSQDQLAKYEAMQAAQKLEAEQRLGARLDFVDSRGRRPIIEPIRTEPTPRRVGPDADWGGLKPGQTYPGGPVLQPAQPAAPAAPTAPADRVTGQTVKGRDGSSYVVVYDQDAKPDSKPEIYKIGRDGRPSKVEADSYVMNRNDGSGVITLANGQTVLTQQGTTPLNAVAVGVLRRETGTPANIPTAAPAQPAAPQQDRLTGQVFKSRDGTNYVVVYDKDAKNDKPEVYKIGADGQPTKVDASRFMVNKNTGQGIISINNGGFVETQYASMRVNADSIEAMRRATAGASPAPAAAPAPQPAPAAVPAAPAAPAAPAVAAKPVELTTDQRNGYLRALGYDTGAKGANAEAALNAFASKNGLMGPDKKPDMVKVNAALQDQLLQTQAAKDYIDSMQKKIESGKKLSPEDAKALQWALKLNGGELPISEKPKGTMDGKVGRETRSQTAQIAADFQTLPLRKPGDPLPGQPAPVAAPAPQPAPTAAPAAQPAPAAAPAPQPAPATTAAGGIPGVSTDTTLPGADDGLGSYRRQQRQTGRSNTVIIDGQSYQERAGDGMPGGRVDRIDTVLPQRGEQIRYQRSPLLDRPTAGSPQAGAAPWFNMGQVNSVQNQALGVLGGQANVLLERMGTAGRIISPMVDATLRQTQYDMQTEQRRQQFLRNNGIVSAAGSESEMGTIPRARGAFNGSSGVYNEVGLTAAQQRQMDIREGISRDMAQRGIDQSIQTAGQSVLDRIYKPQGTGGVFGDLLGKLGK